MITIRHTVVGDYHLFRAQTEPEDKNSIDIATDNDNSPSKGNRLLFKNCRQQITTEDQRLVTNNSHIHTFTNPENFMYRIGCFSSTPGCVYKGIPTMQHTWFKGHSWRFAECTACRLHLGWFFQESGGGNFSALILALLTESE